MSKILCSVLTIWLISMWKMMKFKLDMIQAPPDAIKLYRLCQFGLQYMMNTVSKLGDNTLLVKDYINIQEAKRAKLMELLQSQEDTLHKLKKKKKAMVESERNYIGLLKALQLDFTDPNYKENGNKKPLAYDSEPDQKPDFLNLKRTPLKKKINTPTQDDTGNGKPPLRQQTREEQPSFDSHKDSVDTLKDKIGQLTVEEKNALRRYIIQESMAKGPEISATGDPTNKSTSQPEFTLPESLKKLTENSLHPFLQQSKPQTTGQDNVTKSSVTTQPQAQTVAPQEQTNKPAPNFIQTLLANQRPQPAVPSNESLRLEVERNVQNALANELPSSKVMKNSNKDTEKEEGEVDDEYADDFELSDSMKLSKSHIPPKTVEKKMEPGEETLSFDISKEFTNPSYLENLNKNIQRFKQ